MESETQAFKPHRDFSSISHHLNLEVAQHCGEEDGIRTWLERLDRENHGD